MLWYEKRKYTDQIDALTKANASVVRANRHLIERNLQMSETVVRLTKEIRDVTEALAKLQSAGVLRDR